MREVEKNGILIDVCPSCKGVWLDRGELDKLMQEVREVRKDFNEWYDDDDDDDDDNDDDDRRRKQYRDYTDQDRNRDRDDAYRRGREPYPKRRKKNIMDIFGDLFD